MLGTGSTVDGGMGAGKAVEQTWTPRKSRYHDSARPIPPPVTQVGWKSTKSLLKDFLFVLVVALTFVYFLVLLVRFNAADLVHSCTFREIEPGACWITVRRPSIGIS